MPKYNYNAHIPVLLDEIEQYWIMDGFKNIRYGEKHNDTTNTKINFFDGTFGGGGYSKRLLEYAQSTGKLSQLNLIVADLDKNAIENLDPIFKTAEFKDKISFLNDNFCDAIKSFPDNFFSGIVLDLGFSSNQLEIGNIGLSYLQEDQNLDLRYDLNSGKPAWEILQGIKNEKDIVNIIYRGSGESFSSKIGKKLFLFLQKNPVPITTTQLKELISSVIPVKFQHKKNSIFSRVWQSLRIWVNRELEILEQFMDIAGEKLAPGGVLTIVTFHSLEDKIVAGKMRKLCRPVEIDDFGNKNQCFEIITKKPVKPSSKEILINNRSRSSLLRSIAKK